MTRRVPLCVYVCGGEERERERERETEKEGFDKMIQFPSAASLKAEPSVTRSGIGTIKMNKKTFHDHDDVTTKIDKIPYGIPKFFTFLQFIVRGESLQSDCMCRAKPKNPIFTNGQFSGHLIFYKKCFLHR